MLYIAYKIPMMLTNLRTYLNRSRAALLLIMLYAGSINAQYERLWKVEQENNMTLERPQVVVRADAIGGVVMAYTYDDAGDTNVVVKGLTPQGATRWTTVINESQESVVDVIIDLKFNNYILGHYNRHGFIAKVDSTGNQIWFTELKQSSSSIEVITACALRNDTIVIVGSSTLSSQEKGLVISVSALSGNVLNSSYYNGGEAAVRYLDVAFDENGKSFACGYIEDGGNYNAILHAYNKNLTGYWTTTLQSNAGEDIAYGVCTDLAGNVFSTGCYTQSSNTKIFTCKYSTAGTKKWVNTYDTEGEDRGLYIDFKSDTIAVSGITKQEDSYKDVITLNILTGGSTNWYQVFSGNEGLDDVPTDVRIHEGSVIVPVTGHVVSDTMSALVLLYRSANGNAQHSDRPAATEGVHTKSANVDVDPMGNVLMAYDAENANNKYNVAVAKINRFGVNQKAIQQTLKMLAVGCIPLRTNTSVKEIIYNRIGMVVDSFAQTSVRMLIAACARDSIFIEQEMDAAIAAGFNWADSVTWTQIGIQRLYYKLSKMNPMLYVDNYYAFADTTFINATPPIAYTYLELDYPFNVVTTTNGTLTKTTALSFPSWNLIAVPAPWQMHRVELRYCICEFTAFDCDACSQTTHQLIPNTNWSSSNLDHEIGIYIGEGDPAYPPPTSGTPESWCFISTVDGLNNPPQYYTIQGNRMEAFGVIYALPGYNYGYHYNNTTLGADALRFRLLNSTEEPIYNNYSGNYGWSMSLCHYANYFAGHPTTDQPFELAQGGVYQVIVPFYDFPYYFYFSTGYGIYFTMGPDLNFALSHISPDYISGPFCDSAQTILKFADNVREKPGPYTTTASRTLGLTSTQNQNVFLSSNLNNLTNYWLDNKIDFALLQTAAHEADPANVHTCYASVNPTPCTPGSYSNLGSVILELNCYSLTQEYDIFAPFQNNVVLYNNDEILVHIHIEYANGEIIDQCVPITVTAGSQGLSYFSAVVSGVIDTPLVTDATYEITVYTLN